VTCGSDGNDCTQDVCNPATGACGVPVSGPCNDGNECTADDACVDGECRGTAVEGCSTETDHYKCYKARTFGGPRFPRQTLTLEDQFGETSATLVRPFRFCNPVNKNGEGIVDPVAHLSCYEIHERWAGSRSVKVANQFGEQFLTLGRAQTLCVPAEKDGLGRLEDLNVDHFKCYRARTTPGTPKVTVGDVDLVDQFEEKRTELVKPRAFCTPVEKNGEGIRSPDTHLACFKITDAPGQERLTQQQVSVRDQFGSSELITTLRADGWRFRLLCVPSTKEVACGEASSPECNGFCAGAGVCTANTNGCACG
jgi:hypothetical protein